MITIARKYHKWLMAFIGIQFVLWTLSGFYMVVMDIHFIHGEPMQKQRGVTLSLSDTDYSISDLVRDYPDASDISLTHVMARTVYQFQSEAHPQKWLLLDAKTGQLQPLVNKQQALDIANYWYADNHPISQVELITDASQAPAELSMRHLPFWRIEFDHFSAPTLYINQESGQLVTKRHIYWRLFDWLWRLHIMDYDDGENVGNWLLRLIVVLGLVSAFAGAVLTYYRVFKPEQQEVK